MNNKNGKWWLAVVAIVCLVPAAFAHNGGQGGGGCDPRWQNCGCDPHWQNCGGHQPMPEGGSTAIYLLGAGLTCAGALFLRSRLAKPQKS